MFPYFYANIIAHVDVTLCSLLLHASDFSYGLESAPVQSAPDVDLVHNHVACYDAPRLALDVSFVQKPGLKRVFHRVDCRLDVASDPERLGEYVFVGLLALGYEGGKAIITHTENEEAAQNLKDLVLSSYPDANIQIFPTRGLCSYYMERKGVVISCETK